MAELKVRNHYLYLVRNHYLAGFGLRLESIPGASLKQESVDLACVKFQHKKKSRKDMKRREERRESKGGEISNKFIVPSLARIYGVFWCQS